MLVSAVFFSAIMRDQSDYIFYICWSGKRRRQFFSRELDCNLKEILSVGHKDCRKERQVALGSARLIGVAGLLPRGTLRTGTICVPVENPSGSVSLRAEIQIEW